MSLIAKAYLAACKNVYRLGEQQKQLVMAYTEARSSADIQELEEALDEVVAELRVHEKERDGFIQQLTGRV